MRLVAFALWIMVAALGWAADVAPVPDPYGLGERLALIDWLREHAIAIPENASDSTLRDLYLAAMTPAQAPTGLGRAQESVPDPAAPTAATDLLGIAALAPRTFLDERVTLQVPEDFAPAAAEHRSAFFGADAPDIVLCDPSGGLYLAIDHTGNGLAPQQLAHAHRNFEIALRASHPEATWLRSELHDVNRRHCFTIDLRRGDDARAVRALNLGTALERHLLLITCLIPREREAQWLPTAQRILKSLVVDGAE